MRGCQHRRSAPKSTFFALEGFELGFDCRRGEGGDDGRKGGKEGGCWDAFCLAQSVLTGLVFCGSDSNVGLWLCTWRDNCIYVWEGALGVARVHIYLRTRPGCWACPRRNAGGPIFCMLCWSITFSSFSVFSFCNIDTASSDVLVQQCISIRLQGVCFRFLLWWWWCWWGRSAEWRGLFVLYIDCLIKLLYV